MAYTPPPLVRGYTPPPLVKGYTPPPLTPGYHAPPVVAQGPNIPNRVSGSIQLNTNMNPNANSRPLASLPLRSGSTMVPGLKAPVVTSNTGKPATTVAKVAPTQTPQQILDAINVLTKQLNAGVKVPPALALTHIASLLNQLPTKPNMPGSLSLANIQKALTPGKNTPGYVNPQAAATAAAQQLYGGAVSQDRLNLDQQSAQNESNLHDIQGWYNTLVGQEKSNAASDASGYSAAIQGTGNLGAGVSSALGFDAGSAGADTIGQTGSILNSAARMAGASGAQYDRNLQSASALGGVQDYQNEMNRGNTQLAGLRDTLSSDIKNKGAAYESALEAARTGNSQNAQQYAGQLGQLNQDYNSNFDNYLKQRSGTIGALAGLNSQYSAQGLNAIKTHLAALGTAAAIYGMPGAQATATAKAGAYNAQAYKNIQQGDAAAFKAQTDRITANLKAHGTNLLGTSPKAGEARSQLGASIYKSILGDPRVFNHDPLSGAVTLKSAKLAKADIARMLLLAGLDPSKGGGSAIASLVGGWVTGTT